MQPQPSTQTQAAARNIPPPSPAKTAKAKKTLGFFSGAKPSKRTGRRARSYDWSESESDKSRGISQIGRQPYLSNTEFPKATGFDGSIQSGSPSRALMDTSRVQMQPRKRPRLELNSRSALLREGLQDLNVHELEDLIEDLDQRAKQLGSMRGCVSKSFKHLILYRIPQNGNPPSHPHLNSSTMDRNNSMTLYFDPPQWTHGQAGPGVLRSQLPVTNFDLYLERNKDISFIVYKTYVIPEDIPNTRSTRDRNSAPPDLNAAVVDESIQPVNEILVSAVEALLEAKDEYASILGSFRAKHELAAPYLFVFHQRNERQRIQQSLPEYSHQQLSMLWDYIVRSQGAEYAAADSQISLGKTSPELLKYLFKPGQLLVQNKDDEMQGWICEDWPRVTRRGETIPFRQAKISGATKPEKSGSHAEPNLQWEFSAWHWEFDGEFRGKKETLSVSIDAGNRKESTVPINSLDIFPLKYASTGTVNQLRRRGKNFWKCRKRALVSYRGDADTNDSNLVSVVCL